MCVGVLVFWCVSLCLCISVLCVFPLGTKCQTNILIFIYAFVCSTVFAMHTRNRASEGVVKQQFVLIIFPGIPFLLLALVWECVLCLFSVRVNECVLSAAAGVVLWGNVTHFPSPLRCPPPKCNNAPTLLCCWCWFRWGGFAPAHHFAILLCSSVLVVYVVFALCVTSRRSRR